MQGSLEILKQLALDMLQQTGLAEHLQVETPQLPPTGPPLVLVAGRVAARAQQELLLTGDPLIRAAQVAAVAGR